MKFGKNKTDKYYYLKIGEKFELHFYPKVHHICFKYELAGYFDRRHQIDFSIGFGWFVIYLPFLSQYDECDPPKYGFYYYESAMWFCYGRKIKAYHMPWDYDWHRTSVLLKNQSMEHSTLKDRKSFYEDVWKDKIWYGRYPFTYVLKNEKVQERLATIYVEEMEWRMRWFKWTKLFNKVCKSINVEFSGEVGERTGTWKGGTIGCSYTMLPKESPLACLKRMEKDRKF